MAPDTGTSDAPTGRAGIRQTERVEFPPTDIRKENPQGSAGKDVRENGSEDRLGAVRAGRTRWRHLRQGGLVARSALEGLRSVERSIPGQSPGPGPVRPAGRQS